MNNWTYAVFLVTDTMHPDETEMLKIGNARDGRGGNLEIDLAPGISVSGRIVVKVVPK